MHTIRIIGGERTAYTSMVFAGLYELRASGRAELAWGPAPEAITRAGPVRDPFVVWLELIRRSEKPVKVCIDLRDGAGFASVDYLELADVYLKRGYDAEYVRRLPQELIDKVRPFGLHFACSSPHENLWDIVAGYYLESRGPTGRLREMGGAAGRCVKAAGRHVLSKLGRRFHEPMQIAEFENDPESDVSATVFFRTRVYAPEDAPGAYRKGELEHVNEMRANVVRALRLAFGDRFAGGIRQSEFALANYGDCVIDRHYGHAQHVQESRSRLINVSTVGLHHSTGWKLAEILAASTCIVCEPPRHDLPEPLVAGKHYLGFSDPDECVAACERILSDRTLASRMRNDNHGYYVKHVRPDRVMLRAIQRADGAQSVESAGSASR